MAKGSSVPACPVRAPVRRRSCATIANEDGPGGLVPEDDPDGSSARGGTRASGDAGDGLVGRPLGLRRPALAVPAATNSRTTNP